MTDYLLWLCLSKDSQDILRALMPKGWQPPVSKERLINVDRELTGAVQVMERRFNPRGGQWRQ